VFHVFSKSHLSAFHCLTSSKQIVRFNHIKSYVILDKRLDRKHIIHGNRPKIKMASVINEENASDKLPFSSSYHTPVLCNECVEWLITDKDGIYVDGTLGGGGHSHAICTALEQLQGKGRLISLDRDPEALKTASKRLAPFVPSGRFMPVKSNFQECTKVLRTLGLEGPCLSGMLLDLGVSSHQLDEASRGFSYISDGPLDMRMEGHDGGLSADEVVNSWEEERLAWAIYEYGEERRSRKIARNIVQARPITSTRQLAEIAGRGCKREERVKTLSRVFQGIRIAVNGEMDALESILTQARTLIKPGGRIVVLSYHSLEDRRVKRILNDGNFEGKAETDFYGNRLAPWDPVSRKALLASQEEIEKNPRARSVKMRIAVRTELA